MRLSISEKQTLIGPLVVGCLFGAFVAFAVFAFASEYKSLVGSWWQTVAEAGLAFLAAMIGTVCLLGVLPIAVQRLRSKDKNNA